jgi:GntR family transcriptional repressor for pyruvate dehydrogenase complex
MAESSLLLLAQVPVDRRRTYELVADRLLDLIASEGLAPGTALPTERELSAAFAVGRSSVREALRMLESQGVIVSASGGSFVVADAARPLRRSLHVVMSLRQDPSLAELFELRRIVECEAAALAAERHAADHLDRMDAAVEEMVAGLADDRADVFIDADVRFHLAVSEAAGNRLLAETMEAIRDVLRSALAAIFEVPHSAERAIGEHRAIRAAVAAGDADGVRRATRAHLDRVEADARVD